MESQSHEATRSQGHKGPQNQSLKLQDRCGLGLQREHGPGHSDLRCLGPGTEWTSLLLPRHFGGPGGMVGGGHTGNRGFWLWAMLRAGAQHC